MAAINGRILNRFWRCKERFKHSLEVKGLSCFPTLELHSVDGGIAPQQVPKKYQRVCFAVEKGKVWENAFSEISCLVQT